MANLIYTPGSTPYVEVPDAVKRAMTRWMDAGVRPLNFLHAEEQTTIRAWIYRILYDHNARGAHTTNLTEMTKSRAPDKRPMTGMGQTWGVLESGPSGIGASSAAAILLNSEGLERLANRLREWDTIATQYRASVPFGPEAQKAEPTQPPPEPVKSALPVLTTFIYKLISTKLTIGELESAIRYVSDERRAKLDPDLLAWAGKQGAKLLDGAPLAVEWEANVIEIPITSTITGYGQAMELLTKACGTSVTQLEDPEPSAKPEPEAPPFLDSRPDDAKVTDTGFIYRGHRYQFRPAHVSPTKRSTWVRTEEVDESKPETRSNMQPPRYYTSVPPTAVRVSTHMIEYGKLVYEWTMRDLNGSPTYAWWLKE